MHTLTCTHAHSEGSTTTTSPSASCTLKRTFRPRVGPRLPRSADLTDPGPSGPGPALLLQKQLPNLRSLGAHRPESLRGPARGEGSRDPGAQYVTPLRHSGASFPQMGRSAATGHVPHRVRRLRAQGDVPEPSVRSTWGLLMLVMELDRPERDTMTWRSSGDTAAGGQRAPICCP